MDEQLRRLGRRTLDLWVLRGFSEPSVTVEETMAVVKVTAFSASAAQRSAGTQYYCCDTSRQTIGSWSCLHERLCRSQASIQLHATMLYLWQPVRNNYITSHACGRPVQLWPTLYPWRGASQTLVEEGKVKYVGLANCTADELRRAHAVHPISAIEVEWSLCARHNEASSVPLHAHR